MIKREQCEAERKRIADCPVAVLVQFLLDFRLYDVRNIYFMGSAELLTFLNYSQWSMYATLAAGPFSNIV